MKKKFTIHCPVCEIWVMQVEAENEEDALKKISAGIGEQLYSFAGNTKSGDDENVSVEEIEE